jgi:signal transduction histidine kinase/CheY-like chemotaxis protein
MLRASVKRCLARVSSFCSRWHRPGVSPKDPCHKAALRAFGCGYDRRVPDEVRRLGQLFRAFVWGQLVAATIWVIVTIAIAPESVVFRISVLAAQAAVSFATLALERSGRLTAAAILLVTTIWMILALRVLATAAPSHGAWFLFAVLVGVAGLFIGLRAALATAIASAAYGLIVLALAERDLLVAIPAPGPWLDWVAGILLFSLIAILQVAAVRLYRGGLELASAASLRHRALFDSAPIALFELDLHGERPVTTDANETARRLLGRDDDAAIAAPGEVVDALVAARGRGQQLIDQELAIELAGEQRQVIVRAELPAAGDDLHNVVVSLVDVTEQRRLAERVHDARRFETVASVAGSIAHDFNNLLTVSQLNADRLGRRVSEVRASQELERIRDANTRASGLTRQLLVFSRRDIAHRQVFDPDRVIDKVVALLRRTLDPRIELAVELCADGGTVEMDPAQLELVLSNLVHNAADSIGERGTLRIECRRKRDGIAIIVSDTGAGMTAAAKARAFEPFFTTRPGKRAGLGLPIVQSVVHEAGGTVAIESTPGAGTRVEILLPLANPIGTAADASTAGLERILLVEDDDGVREVARSTLEEAGYTVIAVRSGAEALAEVANGASVDLVVSDLVMPGLGGRELVDRLRASRPKLPVLYVSGHAADGPPVLGDSRVGFLAKPFSASQLLASVRLVLPDGP